VVATISLAVTVVVATAAIVVGLHPSPPSPIGDHVTATVHGPAGLAAGTTPSAGGRSWVTAVTARGAVLERFDTTTGHPLQRIALHGPNDPTNDVSVAFVGQSDGTLAVVMSTTEPGASWTSALALFDARSGAALADVALPTGTVLDVNTEDAPPLVEVLERTQAGVVNESIDWASITRSGWSIATATALTTRLPAATIGTVLTPNRVKIDALQSNGSVDVVVNGTGRVLGTIPGVPGTTAIGNAGDGAILFLLVPKTGPSRVELVDAATGADLGAVAAQRSTKWILPTTNGSGLVEFSSDATAGSITTVAL
jgi:hypothetical protein